MKIAIYSSSSSDELSTLIRAIESYGSDCVLNPCGDESCDIAISYGGDGTFLSTARRVVAAATPILGVNAGRLGFLAENPCYDPCRIIEMLHSNSYTIENRAMISVSGIDTPHGDALNEFTVQKSTSSMINITTAVDNLQVASYWADGVIVSTPTGSTAYSMSVGGAILTPHCRCFVISPIAPHNLNIRPLVIPDNAIITLKITTRQTNNATATIDNRDFQIPNQTIFTIKLSPHTVKIIKPLGISFYDTLREKLHWGVDPRGV